jgi:hypothetical protein
MDSLEEELVAVEAIFPECISRDVQSSHRLSIHPFSDSGSNTVSITLSIPEDYPVSPPAIIGFVGISQSLVREILNASWVPGEVCLYVFVDKLRELPYGLNADITQSSTPRMSLHSYPASTGSSSGDDDNDDEEDRDYEFAVSNPIVDRKSTFVGRAIKVHSRAEARVALLWLKNHNKKIARATHNIVAWRVVEDGILMQGTLDVGICLFLTDNDDDGEDAAGGRLAHLLNIMVNHLTLTESLTNEGHQKCYGSRQQVVWWHHVAR